MAKARTSTKTLTEQFEFSGGKVVREGAYPVIKDVLLCGPLSANKRRYPGSAFKTAENKLYDGRPVFLNHATGSRKYEDRIGWIENERRRADGMPIGDIGINPKHREAESILWAAENRPNFAGMSHVAECQSDYGGDGWEDVRKVVSVESVDLVVDPATTKGFHESKGHTMKTIKFAKLVENIAGKLTFKRLLAAKKLAEMDGVGDMEVMAPAEDAAGDQSMNDAFAELLASVGKEYAAGNLTADETIAKLTAFVKAHAGEADKPAEGDPKESKTPAAGLTLEQIEKLLDKKLADAAKTAEAAKQTEEKPKSGSKAQPKKESTGGDLPADAKSLNELVRGKA